MKALTSLLAIAGAMSAMPLHADPAYSISTPDAALTGMVAGASVTIQLGAPSSALLSKATLKLNGANVTSAMHADGAGSMTGVVAGLQPGANVFELWSKNSSAPVATLTVMKAMAPTATCTSLATLAGFPVQPSGTVGGTRVTSSTLATDANGTQYCLVQGIIEERNDGIAGIATTTSYKTTQHYGTLFEVRLPTAWNGRYMFQGSGGTEGNRPGATGQIGGTAGLNILRNGFVVASQNGGHQTSELPASYPPGSTTTDLNHIQVIQQNMFFPDAKAVADWGYHSIDITTQTAKYLINAYYGRPQEHSYFVGCSTSGRQGMAMSQLFPQHFEGIVAGDPFYLPPEISLSETWGLEHIIAVSPIVDGKPQYLQSFTLSDQNLFTNAILAACDQVDGLVDGVIEDMKACSFDPATFVFPSSGPYVSGSAPDSPKPGMPLQCTDDGQRAADGTVIRPKSPMPCLTSAQVNAAKKIAEGPRTSNGERITTPDGTTLSGYPFDGGFMQPSGIPTRDIGTANSAPGNIGLGSGQLPLFWFSTPDPMKNPLTIDYDNDISLVTPASPAVNNSRDIGAFINRGGKLIFYHGLSDSGPPWPYTQKYFHDVMTQNGGMAGASKFMKLYLVPNMGHCSGNMATDSFDMLTPMVNWIENGVAPEEIVATGNRFMPMPLAGPYAGLGSATRSRPLCPYPKTLHYNGSGDVAQASSYACQ